MNAETNQPEIVVRVQPTRDVLGMAWIGTTGYWINRHSFGFLFAKFDSQGGESYTVYTVRGAAVSCTCPDAKFRKKACKHMRCAAWMCEIEAHTVRNQAS